MKLRQLVSRLPKSDSRETRELVAALAHIFRQADDAEPRAVAWTPDLSFATAGDLSVTYSTQQGSYTKAGRLIFADFNLITSAFTHTTASGNARINGLPFAASADTGYAAAGSVVWAGITKANYTQVVPFVFASASRMSLVGSGSGQSAAILTASDFPTGGTVQLRGSIVYRI